MITCGTNECTAPSLTGAGPLAGLLEGLLGGGGGGGSIGPNVCCAGEAEDICGVSQDLLAPGQCFEQMQVGQKNAACEGVSLAGLPFEIAGCCKPTGQCGLDLSLLGVGCMERTEVSKVAETGPLGSFLTGAATGDAGLSLEPLQAVPCEYEEEAPADAGMPDAGGNNNDDDAGTDAGTPDDGGTDAGTPDDGGADDASV